MSKWNFSFDNAPLSLALQEKLDKAGLLRAIPTVRDASTETRFVKNFFTADGFPHMGPDAELSEVVFPYLFPAIAPWYDNATIPAAIMEMDALYRQSACEAALAWLFTIMEASGATNHIDTSRTFHGLAFQETIQGITQTFCFPDTRIGVTSKNAPAAVVLIADSYWNNEAWEKQSAVPLYARQQAQFQLWCWDRFADKLPADSPFCEEIPRTAIIVRISGNLSVDCTIRIVDYNPKEAFSLVDRICKAKAQEPQKGLYWKRNIESVQKWAEKIENEAYITENVDLHVLSPYHKKGEISTDALNALLQDAFNPDRGQPQIKSMGQVFRFGDRVMQLKNTETAVNGDVGTIQMINSEAEVDEPCMVIQFDTGTIVEYTKDELNQLELAYAISVHKSQGSQYPCVVIVLPNEHSSFLRRDLVYTGATRASKYVAFFGPLHTLQYAIANGNRDGRCTALVPLLRQS